MRTLPFRIIPALLLVAWALSHADGGEPKGKGEKNGRPAPAKEVNSVERIRSALDQTMAMDFSGISIMEALQHIREKSGIEFNLDQVAIQLMGINIDNAGPDPITMKGNSKLSVHLRKMLKAHQLAYVIYEDSILITSSELATHRQMRQTVNIEVSDMPLAKALRELCKSYAVCLVIDPRIAKQAQNPVTLTLDGASLETGVRLLAELAGVKAVRMDNVLFVTDEVRAEKIRKEEKDMAPNPLDDGLNPNIPRLGLGALNLNALGIPLNGPAFRAVPLPPKAEEGAETPKEPPASPDAPKKPESKKDVKAAPKEPPPPPRPTSHMRFYEIDAAIAASHRDVALRRALTK
jgi:ACT domain-containing protein